MSPRRNHPRRDAAPEPLDVERLKRGGEGVETWSDGAWQVRKIPSSAALKAYRCPGCDQEVAPGVPHLVTWPADGRGDLADRRHWHTGCWRARERRSPNIQRSRSAPRYG